MACRLNGLFSIGEDFDDEDLLEAEWAAPATPAPLPAPSSSSALSAPTPREKDPSSLHQTLNALNKVTSPDAVRSGLRQISSLPEPPSPKVNHPCPDVARTGDGLRKAPTVQVEFDDWDVDLADLDESDPQTGAGVQNQVLNPLALAVTPARGSGDLIPSVNALRPSNHGRTPPETSSPYRAPAQVPGFISPLATPGLRPAVGPAPPWSPVVFRVPSPSHRPQKGPQPPPQRPWTTPGSHSLFGPGSPAHPTGYSPRPLSTPTLTNHLVQLVSAANNRPRKRPRSGAQHPSTRRFPGPAGLLPQQPLDQSLDDIVVSVPQTPAHGAVARLPSQCSGSQSEEEEFCSGPWGAMKADMGLDERNPTCFLHTYSVVMVLRKAALRQLAQNKVPNMAVQLKSIVHTHTDARAVFRDPTGEIQGTVHRRLLEDRLGELKAGAVLLLKQVGVFSPSHRNHYLNITASNLLRIYPPDGECSATSPASPCSTNPHRLPPVLEPARLSASPPPSAPWGHVSSMQLELEEEGEEERQKETGVRRGEESTHQFVRGAPSREAVPVTEQKVAPQNPAWDEDDDLNELLGDLLEECSSV